MIYFVRTGRLVKIGKSLTRKTLLKRLSSHQCASPVQIDLLGVMEGDHHEERRLHIKFKDERASGEWFCLSQRIADFIEQNCRPFVIGVDASGLISDKKIEKIKSTIIRHRARHKPWPKPGNLIPDPKFNDIIQSFVKNHVQHGGRCQGSVVYEAFKRYCQASGSKKEIPSVVHFSRHLKALGYGKFRQGFTFYHLTLLPLLSEVA